MMKLMCLVIVAGLVCESIQQSGGGEDSDGDSVAAQAREDLGVESAKIADATVFNPNVSFSALPTPQALKRPPFCNYPRNTKCWTEWFDEDDPCGDGDFELISNLRRKFPGKICSDPQDIQVETLSGLTAAQTGDRVTLDPKIGFTCRNSAQPGRKCNDYRVRFSCYPPFCALKVCWTPFFDRDNPSGTGDWELLSDLRRENPGKICEKPMFIEAVTSDGETPADATNENFFIYNPTQGFACRNREQRDRRCRDYKVRFACPCKRKSPEWD